VDLTDLAKLFIQYVLPSLIAGAGLLANWQQWGLEKRRERLKRRRELVDSWRNGLLKDLDLTGYAGSSPGPKYKFMETPEYASLRPHLSEKLRSQLEQKSLIIGGGSNYPRAELIEEIARKEREWGLI
jgi:hypothetical protein